MITSGYLEIQQTKQSTQTHIDQHVHKQGPYFVKTRTQSECNLKESVHLFDSLWLCFSQIRIATVAQLLCVDSHPMTSLTRLQHYDYTQSPQRRLNTAQSPYYVLYSVTQLYFNSQQTRYIVLYFRAATHPSVVSNKSVQCLSARQAHYMFQNMKPPLELLTQSLSLRSSQFQFSSSPAALCR